MTNSITPWIAWACLQLVATAALAQNAAPVGAAKAATSPTRFKPLKGVPRTEFYWGVLGAMKIPVYSEDLLPVEARKRNEPQVVVFGNCGAGFKHEVLTFMGFETCETTTLSFVDYLKRKKTNRAVASKSGKEKGRRTAF